MKILVTGGAGFIGSHLCKSLLTEGYEVVVLDNLSHNLPNSCEELETLGAKIIVADIRNVDPQFVAIKDVDAVIHLAAKTNVEESVKDPLTTHDVNVRGTLNLLEVCRVLDVEKFIFASSAAVYGSATPPHREDTPLRVISAYGASKAAAEQYCSAYSSSYGIKTRVLRIFNAYGPGQRMDGYSGVISQFVSAVMKGKEPTIYGDGQQTRDFIHVSDVVQAFMASLKRNLSGIFNIGSGRPTSIRELAELILTLSSNGHIKPKFAPPRPGDIRQSCADTSRTANSLGWRPGIRLEDGLKELMDIRINGEQQI